MRKFKCTVERKDRRPSTHIISAKDMNEAKGKAITVLPAPPEPPEMDTPIPYPPKKRKRFRYCNLRIYLMSQGVPTRHLYFYIHNRRTPCQHGAESNMRTSSLNLTTKSKSDNQSAGESCLPAA